MIEISSITSNHDIIEGLKDYSLIQTPYKNIYLVFHSSSYKDSECTFAEITECGYRFLTDLWFSSATNFTDGMCSVVVLDKLRNLMSPTGKMLPFWYNEIEMVDGSMWVCTNDLLEKTIYDFDFSLICDHVKGISKQASGLYLLERSDSHLDLMDSQLSFPGCGHFKRALTECKGVIALQLDSAHGEKWILYDVINGKFLDDLYCGAESCQAGIKLNDGSGWNLAYSRDINLYGEKKEYLIEMMLEESSDDIESIGEYVLVTRNGRTRMYKYKSHAPSYEKSFTAIDIDLPVFDSVKLFDNNGCMLMVSLGGRHNLLNEKGLLLPDFVESIDCHYLYEYNFVARVDNDGKSSLYNSNGRLLAEGLYDLTLDGTKVCSDGKYNIILWGQFAYRKWFEAIGDCPEVVMENGGWYILDPRDNTRFLNEVGYDRIVSMPDNSRNEKLYMVTLDGKCNIFSSRYGLAFDEYFDKVEKGELGWVVWRAGECNVIKDRDYLFKNWYGSISVISEQLLLVTKKGDDNCLRTCIITYDEEERSSGSSFEVGEYRDGLYEVSREGRIYIRHMDSEGYFIESCWFRRVNSWEQKESERYWIVENMDGNYNVYDTLYRKFILDIWYTTVETHEGFIVVYEDRTRTWTRTFNVFDYDGRALLKSSLEGEVWTSDLLEPGLMVIMEYTMYSWRSNIFSAKGHYLHKNWFPGPIVEYKGLLTYQLPGNYHPFLVFGHDGYLLSDLSCNDYCVEWISAKDDGNEDRICLLTFNRSGKRNETLVIDSHGRPILDRNRKYWDIRPFRDLNGNLRFIINSNSHSDILSGKKPMYTVVDESGKYCIEEGFYWKSPASFDYISVPDRAGYMLVKRGERMNLMDSGYNLVFPLWFDDIGFDYKKTVTETMSYYDDENGRIEESPYTTKVDSHSYSFHEGWVKVRIGTRYNYMNTAGVLMSDTWYDKTASLSGQFRYVLQGGLNNIIDSNGKVMLDEWCDSLTRLGYDSDITVYAARYGEKHRLVTIQADSLSVSNEKFDKLFKLRKNRRITYIPVIFEGVKNYCNSECKLILPSGYSEALLTRGRDLYDGTGARIGDQALLQNMDGKIGIFDIGGSRFITDMEFDEVIFQKDTHETPEFYGVRCGDKYNYLRYDGTLLSNRWFDTIYGFYGGCAGVQIGTGKHFIDKTGKIITDFPLEAIGRMEGGRAVVRISGYYNIMRKDGSLVFDPSTRIEDIVSNHGEYFSLKIQGKEILADTDGHFLAEGPHDKVICEYKYAKIINNNDCHENTKYYRYEDGKFIYHYNALGAGIEKKGRVKDTKGGCTISYVNYDLDVQSADECCYHVKSSEYATWTSDYIMVFVGDKANVLDMYGRLILPSWTSEGLCYPDKDIFFCHDRDGNCVLVRGTAGISGEERIDSGLRATPYRSLFISSDISGERLVERKPDGSIVPISDIFDRILPSSNALYFKVERDGLFNFISFSGEILSDSWSDVIDIYGRGIWHIQILGLHSLLDRAGVQLNTNPMESCRIVEKNGRLTYLLERRVQLLFGRQEMEHELLDSDTRSLCKCKDVYLLKNVGENAQIGEGYIIRRTLLKYDLLDAEGNKLNNAPFDRYDTAMSESFELAHILLVRDGRTSVFSIAGHRLVQDEFVEVISDMPGVLCVKRSSEWNILNCYGDYLSDKWFDSIVAKTGNCILVSLGGRYNFINTNGSYSFHDWFDDCVPISKHNLCIVRKGELFNVSDGISIIHDHWVDDLSSIDRKDGNYR